MENNIFVYTSRKNKEIKFERFHICTWEFRNNTSLVEFGGEIINSEELKNINEINFSIYIPWINSKSVVNDLYDKLKEPENSKFIFNDSVSSSEYLDDGQQKKGVIQNFEDRNKLCILPLKTYLKDKTITVSISLKSLHSKKQEFDDNIYFRFYSETKINYLSTRKTGISHSTIIYDFKINEKRNLPNEPTIDLQEESLCQIKSCFFFNITPNSYELNFFDNTALKNIRSLEYNSFKKYLGDKRVKKDELVVVFNKKSKQDSYSFFSVYSKERIGAGQFALAVLVSLFSGILLFMPAYKKNNAYGYFSKIFWSNLPVEVYISLIIGISVIIYFFWPKILYSLQKLLLILKNKNK